VEQHGVVSRAQLLDLGLSRGWIANHVRSGRWQRVHAGVYATHTGELTFESRVQAALLALGPDAVASHRTAAFLLGLCDDEPSRLAICVPDPQHSKAPDGVTVHRVEALASRRHPSRSLAVTTVEDTVLDLVHCSDREDDVVGWVTRACQRRLTTPARIEAAAGRRRRMRHRALMVEVLADVRDGAASPLERRYLRDVERAHALPRGRRGERTTTRGRTRYSDVRYSRYRTRVELEGLAYHPDDERERDNARDNDGALRGDATLRYGWGPVAGSACQVAAEVAALLSRQGWRGSPQGCRAGCPVGTALNPVDPHQI